MIVETRKQNCQWQPRGWQGGTSILFRDCQSGRAADKAMNATVSSAQTEVGGEWPTRSSTRGAEPTEVSK